jgi:hypothetical protein
MMIPPYFHLEVVEKLPVDLATMPFMDPLMSREEVRYDLSTLGVKWTFSKTGTWYGIWGEFGEGKRTWAYVALVYYWVRALIERNTEMTEGAIHGRSFRIS